MIVALAVLIRHALGQHQLIAYKDTMDEHRATPAASAAGRSNRRQQNRDRSGSGPSRNAQKDYERYLALARAESQIGNTVGAENYYQHAEHYFRSMRSDPDGT
jgi:hypothetical protein